MRGGVIFPIECYSFIIIYYTIFIIIYISGPGILYHHLYVPVGIVVTSTHRVNGKTPSLNADLREKL